MLVAIGGAEVCVVGHALGDASEARDGGTCAEAVTVRVRIVGLRYIGHAATAGTGCLLVAIGGAEVCVVGHALGDASEARDGGTCAEAVTVRVRIVGLRYIGHAATAGTGCLLVAIGGAEVGVVGNAEGDAGEARDGGTCAEAVTVRVRVVRSRHIGHAATAGTRCLLQWVGWAEVCVVGDGTVRLGARQGGCTCSESITIRIGIPVGRGVHHHGHVLVQVAASIANSNVVVAGGSAGHRGVRGGTVADRASTGPCVADGRGTCCSNTQVECLVAADRAVARGTGDLHRCAGYRVGKERRYRASALAAAVGVEFHLTTGGLQRDVDVETERTGRGELADQYAVRGRNFWSCQRWKQCPASGRGELVATICIDERSERSRTDAHQGGIGAGTCYVTVLVHCGETTPESGAVHRGRIGVCSAQHAEGLDVACATGGTTAARSATDGDPGIEGGAVIVAAGLRWELRCKAVVVPEHAGAGEVERVASGAEHGVQLVVHVHVDVDTVGDEPSGHGAGAVAQSVVVIGIGLCGGVVVLYHHPLQALGACGQATKPKGRSPYEVSECSFHDLGYCTIARTRKMRARATERLFLRSSCHRRRWRRGRSRSCRCRHRCPDRQRNLRLRSRQGRSHQRGSSQPTSFASYRVRRHHGISHR